MAPLTPTWVQPSHPDIQEVIVPVDASNFMTKSISKIDLAPYAVFAKMAFPPCTKAKEATYATVQMGKHEHLDLNSDLVYINHSCDPSLMFDMSSLAIIAGARGLKAGEELSFFYPSTEWDMDQGFDCYCGSKKCLGYIGGAKHMTTSQLEGRWLNAHIRSLLEDHSTPLSSNPSQASIALIQSAFPALPVHNQVTNTNSNARAKSQDRTEAALQASLVQARKMVDAAQAALDTYISIHSERENVVELGGKMGDDAHRGVSSRELSGEMGGDTVQV